VTAAAKEAARAESLALLMRTLKLPAFSRYAEEIGERAERGLDLQALSPPGRARDRGTRRRHIGATRGLKLPAKTERSAARLPAKIQKTLPALVRAASSSAARTFAFGLPGAARRTSPAASGTG
jgi:hypothetical protein